jgi:alpha-galactosidase
VTRGRLAPARVGILPLGAAGLTQQSLTVQELAVAGIISGDRDGIYQAIIMDPQASATLTLAGMSKLLDDLLAGYGAVSPVSSRRLSMFDKVPG